MPLQVEEDPDFSRLERRFARAGLVVLVVLVVSAALGLLGDGPLNPARVEQGDLRVDYPRFARQRAEAVWRVSLAPDESAAGVELVVARSLLDPQALELIWPQPDAVIYDGEAIRLRYLARPGLVVLRLRPQSAGLLSGEISLPGRQVRVSTIVYP